MIDDPVNIYLVSLLVGALLLAIVAALRSGEHGH